METLWSGLGMHKASNNLHQILHAARRALGKKAKKPKARPEAEACRQATEGSVLTSGGCRPKRTYMLSCMR